MNKWLTGDEIKFVSRPQLIAKETLPPGYYKTYPVRGEVFFEKINDMSDDILRFGSDSTIEEAVSEIRSFWDKKDFFKLHNFPFRRGILLHGPPGSGKSCAIKMIVEDITKQRGIAISMTDVESFETGMAEFRKLQPNTNVVVIMEDLDDLLYDYEVEILNMMDGVGGFDGVVFLATTNHLKNLPPRLRNRPSRFDRRFHIGFPSLETRTEYFTHLANQAGIGKENIEKFAELSEKLSFAHMKELFVSVMCFGSNVEIVAKRLVEMAQIPDEDDEDEDEEDPRTPPTQRD
jgi:SpoVK/Ycf46/Vps4 family AAA+-type ATPase